jgi:aminoglycoside phosphotransferase (APT) family kinase protein
MTEQNDSQENKFKAYLSNKIPNAKALTITNFIRMTEGFSYETFLIDAQWTQDNNMISQGFAIRMVPEAGVVEPYDIKAHYKILKAVEDSPVPAPKPYWLEMDSHILGRPFFVMEKVEGEVPIPFGFKDHPIFRAPEKRLKMVRNLVQVLADYQAIDWRRCADFLRVPKEETDPARMEIARWEKNIEKFKIYPQPLLREVNIWIKRNMPRTPFFTLTHGDFRLGNFIWRDEKIVAFLDWEMPGIGDPMMDLAMICWKILRTDNPNLMCMLIEREELYRIYEELTGMKVDEERVYYWEAFVHYKAASVFISGVRAFSDGKNRDVRLISLQDSIHYACLKELSDLVNL